MPQMKLSKTYVFRTKKLKKTKTKTKTKIATHRDL
jgi:hypothetical protein